MPLPTEDVIGILSDNLRLRGSVLPIPKRSAIGWARGLDLPRGGETVLYSGLMVQLIPYIEGLVKMRGAARRLLPGPLHAARPADEPARQPERLHGAARPRARGRPTTASSPTWPGCCSARASSSATCTRTISTRAPSPGTSAPTRSWPSTRGVSTARSQKHGVKHVITIDPHTTNMLRTVYPKLVDGYDLRVSSYLEVLAERDSRSGRTLSGELALHDSCVFARFENVIEQPRALLGADGHDDQEPEHAGRLTWCCGGPAESLYPKKALAQAQSGSSSCGRSLPKA